MVSLLETKYPDCNPKSTYLFESANSAVKPKYPMPGCQATWLTCQQRGL